MSKNITIQESGIAKQLNADKLKTNLVSGGTCLWVPEDDVQLTTKTITENGTYKASDDGYFGYEQVTVNIAKSGIATGTDTDGDEAAAYTDPDTGQLVEEKVPSSIEVITPPTNPYGIYMNGATIGTEGMVVKAYLKTGGEYGTVPNGEISLNPVTAVYDASTDEEGYVQVNNSPFAQISSLIPFRATGGSFALKTTETTYNLYQAVGGSRIGAFVTSIGSRNHVQTVFASENQFSFGAGITTYKPDGSHGTPAQTISAAPYTYDNKTVYYGFSSGNLNGEIDYADTYNGTEASEGIAALIAWAMIYGETETHQAGSRQTITVSWPRPRDGKVLETSFEILVAPGYTQNGGE